ncbi:MAG TPA: ribonuclease HII [Rhabdaerophilum sp.]|nr:ribonuclease HII [Rhabdaerophilum sp.]
MNDLAGVLHRWQAQGVRRIAGVDEVGRGPLAGPVVAAAVVLPDGFDPTGITDSKKLSANRREALATRLMREARVGIAYLPAPDIDRLNIHQATLTAMAHAIAALPEPPEAVLIDGKFVPATLSCPGFAVIGGDARVAAIGAASIVAKVARDRLMAAADRHFPGYGFAGHAGYPTPAHKAMLAKCGLTPLHRLSYAPCRALL